jgi:predicted LPLAT superfamily acyltransferase
MANWEGKSQGTPLGYQIFVWILRNFGLQPAYFILRFVSLYYFLFLYKTTKPLFAFFNERQGFDKFKSLIKVYQSYYLIGQSILDKIVVMSGIPNKFTFEFEGEQNLKNMVNAKKGGILLSAHVGNWEIAGYLFKRLDTTMNVVMYDAENNDIKQYLTSVIGKRNVNLILIKNDLSHIYQISEALSRGELICMHADRFLVGNKTTIIDFMGKKAHFPIGPFVLAAQFKVPVSYVFAVKESDTHYHLFASKPKEYIGLKKAETIDIILKEYVSEVAQKVNKYPEQWFNYYDFWKQ